MAKTRADFIKEGHDNAIKMKASNPQDLPTFCNSGSWQAKAYAEGWTEGCKVVRLASQAQDSINHGDVVMPVEYEALQKFSNKPTRTKGMSPSFGLPYGKLAEVQEGWRTAQIHVNQLFREVELTIGFESVRGTIERRNRILAKIAKLEKKWGI